MKNRTSNPARAPQPRPLSALRRFLAVLGPGVVTGAADDDPSGIATYSIAGAQLGLSLLWTAWVSWPLMAAVQMTCARIGMVTGQGLAGALRKRFPRPLLICVAFALLIANSFNIGADLVGMADAAHMLTGWSLHLWVVVFGVGISWATIRLRYVQIANALKWLALTLVAYVLTAFEIGPDWGAVLRATLVPSVPAGRAEWQMLVAILGTTISPYLFFWQASQEVEEEKAMGQSTLPQRQGATQRELSDRRLDVGCGTFFSNAAMFFIILTTGLTLHRHGVVNVQTSSEVARALEPLAGRFAETLYTLGLVGVGLLAIPTLAGSAAYAFAETFGWKNGLDRRPRQARAFYGILLGATAAGVAIDLARLNPVRMLYWSAVLNGLLAPFLLVGVLIVACDQRLMRGQPISLLSRVAVGLAAAAMFAAGAGMFLC
jgi:NRAMP (natural resistance-associated macrophage protein)-like metal ion transporter